MSTVGVLETRDDPRDLITEGDCSLGLVLVLLLLVSSSIVLENCPAQRDHCASAAAPPLLHLAALFSPPARLARLFSGCLSTPRLRSSCVCVKAAWPLGGLPSAACGCSNATDGGTADRVWASQFAPYTRRSRSGRKTACCLVLADVIFSFAHWLGGSETNALWSMAPAWYKQIFT